MKHLQFRSSVASSTSTKSCIEELKILKSSECLFFQPQQTFRTLVSVSASLRENSLTDTNDSSSNTTLFETTKKTLDQVKKNINLSKLETFKLFFKNIINNIITMISNNEVYGALILLDMMIELYQTQANTHLINSSDNNLLHTEDNTQELAANTTNNVIKNLIVNTISNSFTEIIDNMSDQDKELYCEAYEKVKEAHKNKTMVQL